MHEIDLIYTGDIICPAECCVCSSLMFLFCLQFCGLPCCNHLQKFELSSEKYTFSSQAFFFFFFFFLFSFFPLSLFTFIFTLNNTNIWIEMSFCSGSVCIPYRDIMQQAVLVMEHSARKLHFLSQPLAMSAYMSTGSLRSTYTEKRQTTVPRCL